MFKHFNVIAERMLEAKVGKHPGTAEVALTVMQQCLHFDISFSSAQTGFQRIYMWSQKGLLQS